MSAVRFSVRHPAQTRPHKRPAGPLRLLQLLLTIAAERDIGRHDDAQIRGQKRWWRLAALLSPFGPLAYFLFGRRRSPEPEGGLS